MDPARLLEILRGLPASRALLADLQRAASTGRAVQVTVSPDRQIAEIATGSGHYVLTQAARNLVLAELIGRSPVGAARTLPPPAADGGKANPGSGTRSPPASGILWESPSTGSRHALPAESIALPWLGPNANLKIGRDGSGAASAEPGAVVYCATVRLELPQLGPFAAHIRLCGSTVAVSIECDDPARFQSHLAALGQALAGRGLVSAHLGAAATGAGA
jgi:hypothetical protein